MSTVLDETIYRTPKLTKGRSNENSSIKSTSRVGISCESNLQPSFCCWCWLLNLFRENEIPPSVNFSTSLESSIYRNVYLCLMFSWTQHFWKKLKIWVEHPQKSLCCDSYDGKVCSSLLKVVNGKKFCFTSRSWWFLNISERLWILVMVIILTITSFIEIIFILQLDRSIGKYT